MTAKALLLLTIGWMPLALTGNGVFNCGLVTCSQQRVLVVERFGKYSRMLTAGLHFTLPWPIESMRYHDLRERPYEVQRAPAITKDNVDLVLDAVVCATAQEFRTHHLHGTAGHCSRLPLPPLS